MEQMKFMKSTSARTPSTSSTSLTLFDHCCSAALGLDCLLGSGTESVSSDIDGFVQLATTQDFDAVLTGNQSILFENLNIKVLDILSLSKCVKGIDIDTDILYAVDVLEAKLRQATIDGHLTAFEPNFLMVTRPGLCTLITTRSRTALTGTGTAADTLRMFNGTFGGFEII